jgi:hypothetical protein
MRKDLKIHVYERVYRELVQLLPSVVQDLR